MYPGRSSHSTTIAREYPASQGQTATSVQPQCNLLLSRTRAAIRRSSTSAGLAASVAKRQALIRQRGKGIASVTLLVMMESTAEGSRQEKHDNRHMRLSILS